MRLTALVVMLALGTPAPASVLSDHADALAPGTFVRLPDNPSLDGLGMGYSLLYWADSGEWDPVSHRLIWMGGPGSCCADPAIYSMITYDEATDTWAIADTPYTGSGHSYDGNALDPRTGVFYFALFHDQEVKRYEGGDWTTLPAIPFDAPAAMAIAWFADLSDGDGALVYVGGYGNLAWFDGAAWNQVTGAQAEPWGSYNMFAQYNPVLRVVWVGAGNGADTVHYLLDADLGMTRLADAPISLNNSQALHTVDPVSGRFLVTNLNDQTWWELDATTDTWTQLTDLSGDVPVFDNGSRFVVPVPEHGVNLYFKHYWENRDVYLYRHQVAEPDTLAPAPPENLVAE